MSTCAAAAAVEQAERHELMTERPCLVEQTHLIIKFFLLPVEQASFGPSAQLARATHPEAPDRTA